MSDFTPADLPTGIRKVDGHDYMNNATGGMDPVDLVPEELKLEDDVVRHIMGYAVALSEQVSRFKQYTFDDIGALDAILAEKYGATKGSAKGNKTLMSYDGTMKVQVCVADYFDFGTQLNTAKRLVDECLNEWAADAGPEIRAIVTRAFNTDKSGKINRSDMFMLLRLDITDERWLSAMEAVRKAMRFVRAKTYIRCYRRADQNAAWEAVTIDLAKA